MKKVVLSRKYRPKKISDVIGQDFAVKTIKNAFELDKLAHAFLLTGIRGVGKTTIARIIAMGLNCVSVKKPSPDPCNQCNNCKEIIEDRFDEVLELDAASHTSVDDIREIISYVKYRPTKGRYKVFVIDEVHMLSNSAFNALLKTVEEPPDYVKFIFCTTEINKIPITILSRCQKFQLHRVSKEKIILNLKKIVDLEKIKVSEDALINIARFSEGSVRDSITYDFLQDGHFAELKNTELMRERLQLANEMRDYIGKFYSVDYVRKNILKQNAREIEEIDNQIKKEIDDGIISAPTADVSDTI